MVTESTPLTPRQRQRRNTMSEIMTAARRQLRAEEDYSVRSVATEIGLSSQGLYRYVASIEQLRGMVTREILNTVLAQMAEYRDRHEDPAARLAASAVGFRAWALANHAEFRHAFTKSSVVPLPDDPTPPTTPQRMIEFFIPLLAELHTRSGFAIPAEITAASPLADDGHDRPGCTAEDRSYLILVFHYVWARLYGIVALEVFEQIDRSTVESGLFFRVALKEIADRLGVGDTAVLERVLATE